VKKTAPEPRKISRPERWARRKAPSAFRAALPYAAWLIPFAILALVLGAAWPVIFALGGVVHLAADRLRIHLAWHRNGGKAALRRRAAWQGHATPAEISRNLSHDRGVFVGTVRGTR
jgi:hypothetical protein